MLMLAIVSYGPSLNAQIIPFSFWKSKCPKSGLFGQWTFDETSGGTFADSIGSNNGAWTDGINNDVAEETTAGHRQNAIDFGPTSRNVSMSELTVPSEGTLSVWLKTDFNDNTTPSGNHEMLIDSSAPRFSLKYNTDTGLYEFTSNATGNVCNFNPAADYTSWFHLVIVWSG